MRKKLPLYNSVQTATTPLGEEIVSSQVMGTAYIETYGCQMNISDSELMAGILSSIGYYLLDQAEEADVILINTCAIRENAEEKVFHRLQHLNSIKRRKPDIVLGVCGCMAQHLRQKILEAAPFVDIILGPDAYRSLPQAIHAARSKDPFVGLKLDRSEDYADLAPIRQDGVRAWLTIQRGCDKMCTFCVVPLTRGRERSISVPILVEECHRLVDEGFKEIVLLGQTVNSYQAGKHDFGDLLVALNRVEGLRRIRFTSPHPSDASEPMIEAMANCNKVCQQIHLPLQSGSTRVLRAMRRTYTADEYRDLVARMRDRMPNLAISTDIIVGFCGETEENFQQTYSMMAEIRYDSAFMFKYSDREGTLAHKSLTDDVPEKVKIERLQRIIEQQYQISHQINQTLIGKTVEVLVEGESKRSTNDFFGRTRSFKTTVFPRPNANVGDIVPVQINSATAKTLIGNVVSPGN